MQYVAIVLVALISFLSFSNAVNCPSFPTPQPITNMNDPDILSAFDQMDQIFSKGIAAEDIPGLIAVAVYDQQIIWSKGYGSSNPFASAPPPTLDNIVRIASITKVFTTEMLFMLRDQGIVRLDDAVDKYLSDFDVKVHNYNTNNKVSLRQLASHTSGLQREIPCDWNLLVNVSEKDVLKETANTYLVQPMYGTPHYSNLGIALLGRALEKAASTSEKSVTYEQWVEQNILAPLGMTYSQFEYNSFVMENLAIGTDVAPNGTRFQARMDLLGWGNPMGGLFASARDMASFMMQLFRTNATVNATAGQILDGFTINEMLTACSVLNDNEWAYGFPYEMMYSQNYWTMMKAGALAGYRSQLVMMPELRLGIFVTALISDTNDPTVYSLPALNALVSAFEKVLWTLQPAYQLPNNTDVLTGTYYDTVDQNIMVVSVQDGVLIGNDTEGTVGNLTLFDEKHTVFRFQWLTTEGSSCRGVTDGSYDELMFFKFPDSPQPDTHAYKMVFGGDTYYYYSEENMSLLQKRQQQQLQTKRTTQMRRKFI